MAQFIVTVVIPARMASSRYPGKPLVSILGLPLIEHVRRRALLAKGIQQVVVATCDDAIREAVESAGGRVVMTRDTHLRCTDRVEEAMHALPGDIVAMVQGDEPLLDPGAIEAVVAPLREDASLDVVNLLSPLQSDNDYANPDVVKAVCNVRGDLMHLTRAPIPFFRDRVAVPVYRQTGIMGFRGGFLTRYGRLPPTPLERAESIDMLRVLEHGIRIAGIVAGYSTLGVDRPGDVALVEEVLRHDPAQRELHLQICAQGVRL